MAIKNMGTATMRFNEGVFIEGDAVHGEANQLVVTGSISVMGASTAGDNYDATPTVSETMDRTKWYYRTDNNNPANTDYEPRIYSSQTQSTQNGIPIAGGGYWTGEIYTFYASGERMISLIEPVEGTVTVSFKLIAGGGGAQSVAHSIPKSNYDGMSYFSLGGSNGNAGWLGGSGDPFYPIHVLYATDGYTSTSTWTPPNNSVAYHAYNTNHPNAGSANINNYELTSFSFTISGVSGPFYVAIKQNASVEDNYNWWGLADLQVSEAVPSGGYINFEGPAWAQGENGVGIRINNGSMEFKDDGGSWKSFEMSQVGGNDRSIQYNNNGALDGGNFYYGANANIGIGDFSNGDASYLLTVRGNKGGSGNNGYVMIEEHNNATGPGILFQRTRGQFGTETDITDNDNLGSQTYIGRVNGSLQILGGTKTQYHSTIGTNMTFSLKGSTDPGLSNKLFLRDVSLMPHDDIVTSNVGAFVLGSHSNAFGTLYTENIRGPLGTDLKVLATNNDLIMHIGTQGTYANNVGIGTQTPAFPLTVESPTGNESVVELLSDNSLGPELRLSRNGTSSVLTDDGFGSIRFGAKVSTLQGISDIEAAKIEAVTPWNWNVSLGAPFQNSELNFWTKKTIENVVSSHNAMTLRYGNSAIYSNLDVSGTITAGGSFSTDYDITAGDDITANGDIISNRWRINTNNANINTSDLLAEYEENMLFPYPGYLTFNPDSHNLSFRYRDSGSKEVFNIKPSGKTYIGTADGSPSKTDYEDLTNPVSDGGLYIEGVGSTASVVTIVNRDNGDYGDALALVCGYGSYQRQNWTQPIGFPTSENSWIKMYGKKRGYALSANESVEDNPPYTTVLIATIRGDGSGGAETTGFTFTGSHDTVSSETIEIGMIVESTGNLWISHGMSTALPSVIACTNPKSSKVYGVIESAEIRSGRADRVPSDSIGYTVNSLGEGKVWVCNFGGEPSNGDLITSSPIRGIGQIQEDDVMRSCTVGKLTETIDWSKVEQTVQHEGITYKKYLAGCTYHCG